MRLLALCRSASRWLWFPAVCVGALIAGTSGSVGQQGFRIPALEEYCQLKSVTSRETIVYVDGATLVGKPERIPDLVSAINQRLGLAPRERVRIFFVSGTEGAKEIFNKCWPDLTEEEAKATQAPSSSTWESLKRRFDESPEQKLKDTKDFFRQNVQVAIRAAAAAQSNGKPDLVRILSADKDRLASKQVFRILVYSAADSEVLQRLINADAAALETEMQKVFASYPLSLNGADIFFWGVEDNQKTPLSAKETLWAAYLQLGVSNLRSFAPDLPIQETAIVGEPRSFSGTWKSPISEGRVSIKLATDQRDRVMSSWISFQSSVLYSIPIEGSFKCSAQGECRLAAQVARNVPFLRPDAPFQKGDVLELVGDGSSMKGSIKPPSATVFSGANTKKLPMEYTLELKK
jgi:hypothetical protein